MSTPRTPSKRSALARVPSMGSSFASCFGASTPISPRRAGGHGLLGGHVSVNYRKLGFHEDDDEDEDTYTYEDEEELAEERYEHESETREGPFFQEHGKHLALREEARNGMHYASEGELEKHARERKTVKKLGTQWAMREKARRMDVHYASETPKAEEPYCNATEQEGEEHGIRERKGILKLAKLWSMREKEGNSYASEKQEQEQEQGRGEEEAGVYARERRRERKLGKLWVMREKARRGVHNASEMSKEEQEAAEEEIDEGEERFRSEHASSGRSPVRRESLCRKVREACVQVLESARRSSPHLSELFVGNQLLMQVTSSSFNARRANKKVQAPSAGFLVAGDPPLYILSPPCSSSPSTL